MSDQTEDANHDHHHDEIEAKLLTDIYYDCFEKIFDFLEIKDLLNVAQTCKRLQIAAVTKFSQDFTKRACLYHSSSNFTDKLPKLKIYVVENSLSSIHAVGLKCILPFLRCFGSKLSELWVYYAGSNNDSQNFYMNRYISTITVLTHWLTDRQTIDFS